MSATKTRPPTLGQLRQRVDRLAARGIAQAAERNETMQELATARAALAEAEAQAREAKAGAKGKPAKAAPKPRAANGRTEEE